LVKVFKTSKSVSTANIKPTKKELPGYISKNIDSITKNLSVKVDITSSPSGKGKIVIPFHSKEEFQRLKKILTGG
jgi:ParB family chromosome partitioning protein